MPSTIYNEEAFLLLTRITKIHQIIRLYTLYVLSYEEKADTYDLVSLFILPEIEENPALKYL